MSDGRTPVRTLRTLLLAACVAAGTVAPAGAGGGSAARCALNPEPIRTLKIDAKPGKKSYKRGTVAKISVTVTRFYEDPSNTGNPQPLPDAGPVENVDLGLGVYSGSGPTLVYQTKAGKTNAEGKDHIKVKLYTFHEPGPAEVRVRGDLIHFVEGCVTLIEYGYFVDTDLFRIT